MYKEALKVRQYYDKDELKNNQEEKTSMIENLQNLYSELTNGFLNDFLNCYKRVVR